MITKMALDFLDLSLLPQLLLSTFVPHLPALAALVSFRRG